MEHFMSKNVMVNTSNKHTNKKQHFWTRKKPESNKTKIPSNVINYFKMYLMQCGRFSFSWKEVISYITELFSN